VGQQTTWCTSFRLGLIRRCGSAVLERQKGEEKYGVWHGRRKEGPFNVGLDLKDCGRSSISSHGVPNPSRFEFRISAKGFSLGYGSAWFGLAGWLAFVFMRCVAVQRFSYLAFAGCRGRWMRYSLSIPFSFRCLCFIWLA